MFHSFCKRTQKVPATKRKRKEGCPVFIQGSDQQSSVVRLSWNLAGRFTTHASIIWTVEIRFWALCSRFSVCEQQLRFDEDLSKILVDILCSFEECLFLKDYSCLCLIVCLYFYLEKNSCNTHHLLIVEFWWTTVLWFLLSNLGRFSMLKFGVVLVDL